MNKLLTLCLNLFLLFNSVNNLIINAEEPAPDSVDNTNLITEETDSTDEDSISTIASSSIQFISAKELNTLLSSINVSDLYFGTKNDYHAVDFTTYTKYNLKNNYELYYYLDSSSGLSEAYVICDNDKQIVFPESCMSMFATLKTLEQIHFDNINTEYVTNMHGMFADCNNLTYIDISKLNTINVKNMDYMFANCTNISSIDLSNLNTENVTDMNHMFSGCTNLISLDLSNITTHKVTNMSYMFTNCSNLPSIELSNFNTENVTDMSRMFWGCKSLTSLDLSNFKTANVTNMCWMFTDCSNLTYVDTSKFNTENVTNLDHMFYNCVNLSTVDVSNFNTDKVTNMLGMFSNCQNLAYVDVSKFNTENVTNMSWMFASCGKLSSLDVSHFNTEKVTNMEGMFSNLNVTSLDLSSFKTANVTNMGRMFFNCKSLNTIYATTDFIAPSNSEKMFYSCTSLKGEKDTKFSDNKVHDDYARIDGGTDNPGYFSVKHPVKPTLSEDTYTYNTDEQTVGITGFDENTMDIEGNKATIVGNYTVTVKSKNGKWSDGTKEPVTFNWFIVKANPSYTLPNGLNAVQGDMLSDVTLPDGWAWKTPDSQLTDANSNTYKATFTPDDTDNYNVLTDIDVTIDVEAAPIKPTLSIRETYTYVGREQLAEVIGFDSNTMKISGNVQTTAGTHTITVTPIKQWSNGTTEPVTIEWTIEKANPTYSVPTDLNANQGDKLSDIKLPEGWSWNEPDTKLDTSGSKSYTASYTPKDTNNYNVLEKVELTVTVKAIDKSSDNSSTKQTNGWDDEGPFTTDKCGNVFDRWNNKIYEANGCNVGGYNLVRTSVVN